MALLGGLLGKSDDEEDNTAQPAAAAPDAAAPAAPANAWDNIDPMTGFRRGDIASSGLANAGSLGMILMAAGQRMTPEARAQILAQGAGYMNPNKGVAQNVSTRGAMQEQKLAADASAMEKATLAKLMKDPNIPEQEKLFARSNLKGYLAAKFQVDNREESDFDTKMALYRKSGMTDAQIANAMVGRYEMKDDGFGGTKVLDKTTGLPVSSSGGGRDALLAQMGLGPAGGGGGGGGPAPTPPTTGGGAMPGASMAPAGSTPNGVPTNAAQAFGTSAWLDHGVTKAQDWIGNGTGRTPETQQREQAGEYFKTLNNQINSVMASNWEGKPTNWTREIEREGLPDPQAFNTSAAAAHARYRNITQRVDQEYAQTQREGANAIAINDKANAAKAANKLRELGILRGQLVDTVGALEKGLGGQTQTGAPPPGRYRYDPKTGQFGAI